MQPELALALILLAASALILALLAAGALILALLGAVLALLAAGILVLSSLAGSDSGAPLCMHASTKSKIANIAAA